IDRTAVDEDIAALERPNLNFAAGVEFRGLPILFRHRIRRAGRQRDASIASPADKRDVALAARPGTEVHRDAALFAKVWTGDKVIEHQLAQRRIIGLHPQVELRAGLADRPGAVAALL